MKSYIKPQLQRHGSLEALTRGSSTGSVTDVAVPAGTPFSDITFSGWPSSAPPTLATPFR